MSQADYDHEYDAANREMRRIDEAAIARITGTAHRIRDGAAPGQVVISSTCLSALIRAAEGRWKP